MVKAAWSVEIFFGIPTKALLAYLVVGSLSLTGIYTVDQNERAVLTTFGRAERLEGTTLNDPIAESLTDEEKQRYAYPQLRVILARRRSLFQDAVAEGL